MTRIASIAILIAIATACGDSACEPLRDLDISSDQCPDGALKLGLDASVADLQRGALGTLTLRPRVLWIDRLGADVSEAYTGELTATAVVEGFDGDSVLTELEVDPADPSSHTARIAFPDVPDGDHTLVVTVNTGFDTARVRIPVSFYTPALVHVLTDRPLYRPGEDVMLRSLVVRRADRKPLHERPGRWQITAPDGVVLLDEPAKAGSWGVAASSVPLDDNAVHGQYTAVYTSGSDSDRVPFEVRPFELPRTTMEAEPSASWYSRGDRLVVTALARYRSGAPIADAPVVARLQRSTGSWPQPLAWSEPIEARTDADGAVRIDWGAIPDDLRELARFQAVLVVTEPGGETTTAQTSLVLSEDRLAVEAMTELDDKLAGGRNNRAYLRVSTPAGAPLPGAEVSVRNPWNPTARVQQATADEDGVIAIQLDPGDPVTLVTEPMPMRYRPPPPIKSNTPEVRSISEASAQRQLTLQEQRALPTLTAAAVPCQAAETGDKTSDLVMRVSPAGSIRGIYSDDDSATTECLRSRLRSVRFATGAERTFKVKLLVPDSVSPYLDWTPHSTLMGDGSDVVAAIVRARSRQCFTPGRGDGIEVAVHWAAEEGSKRILTDVGPHGDTEVPSSTLACVSRAFSGLTVEEEFEADAVGVSVAKLVVPRLPGAPKPPPKPKATTSTGFELTVAASRGGRDLGQTSIRFGEGTMPPLRLRANPPVVTAGQSVTIEFLRSGDRNIELPKEFTLTQEAKEVVRAELDGNTATFDLPATTDGFLRADFGGAHALVFVQRTDPLRLALETDRESYRPGDTAMLTVRTGDGTTGRPAAVGLVGVDAALGQLRPLPGPDAYGRVMVRAQSSRPAFGTFDAHALLTGRIRGQNAAQAAVQRISKIPADRFDVPAVSGRGQYRPAQQSTLTTSFGRVLGEAVSQIRTWERTAPEAEKMDNPRMAAIWASALKTLRDGGNPALDAYGRELTLKRLPAPMLQQLDPKQLVGDGTRLPEDTVPWVGWVGKEVNDG